MNLNDSNAILQEYRALLDLFRRENGKVRCLPVVPFYLFGMGPRRKLIYQAGALKDTLSGEILQQWDVASEFILPSEYAVHIYTRGEQSIQVLENESGIWLVEDDHWKPLSQSKVNLPAFLGYKFAPVLRVLHQEILINIIDGKPVPNFFVYRKPWYRDAAMMAMVLRETGNMDLIRDWILNLSEPYDRNNAGETEVDNLGQALFLISLVTDASHPLVSVILGQLVKFHIGDHISGRSDFAEHPVYQTKWAKFGLGSLGLADPFTIPMLPDAYSALFWWAYRERHLVGPRFNEMDYPYLDWAEAHFYGERSGPTGDRDYPLSWEANASQADYNSMAMLSPLYVEQKIAAPHTWHASEMFLYLLDAQK